MEIFLLILKIIGILLLVLLLLFLTMILSVIFIPVRYRIKGRAASPDEIEADIVISFLLHLVHGRIQISGSDILYKIRILGIPISLDKEKKPRRKRKSRKKQKTSKKSKVSNLPADTSKEEMEYASVQDNQAETWADAKIRSDLSNKQDSDKQEIVRKPPVNRKRKQKKKRRGLNQLWNACKSWFLWLKQIIAGFNDKSITWKGQIENIKNIILEETNQNAVVFLFREFQFLTKHFSPRKVSGTLQYGMEDPAVTGQILAIISTFPFWSRYQISIQPDFSAESFFVKGDIWMKGRIRALHMLRTVIRLMRNKSIQKLINQIRK